MNLQPNGLEDELTRLVPLQEKDLDDLYIVASDPKVWEQHPVPDRYKKEVFQQFFEGAVASKGAFIVIDKLSGKTIGSTRLYDYDEVKSCVIIGYTFLGRDYWGGTYNRSIKKLLLDYAFNYVDTVIFHIGSDNIRSQKAIARFGARKVKELYVNYGERTVLNYEYEIKKQEWLEHPISKEYKTQLSSNKSQL